MNTYLQINLYKMLIRLFLIYYLFLMNIGDIRTA